MALQRVLEPEVMDTHHEAMAYDAMDHDGVNRAFVDDLLTGGPLSGEVLDLGTGTARIPMALCARDECIRVLAVDLSSDMLQVARVNLEIAGLMERILLARIDAKQLGFADGRFCCVISNSLIHHLPSPHAALAEAVRVTAPTGRLFFRDLLRPRTRSELTALVERYAGGEAEFAQQMFAASLHAALSLSEIRDLIAELGFDPATVQTTSDRHWTWQACRHDRIATPHPA
jgi:ubiquinone/menaquinone biosynthesis C-methylase UbiE